MKYLLFILFPAILTAQNNIQQAESYLGAIRFNQVAPPKGPVQFIFSQTALQRTADGKATYRTLLQQGYFSDAAHYGTLSAVVITEGGTPKVVERYKAAKEEGGTLSRASVGGNSALPVTDSTSIADQMKGFREGIENGAKVARPAASAIWETWMWLFEGYLLPWLIIISILLWFVSALCASESLITLRGFDVAGRAFIVVHSWASFLLALTLSVIALTLLTSVCLWLLKSGSLFLLAIVGIGSAYIAMKIVTKLIPNLPVSGTRSASKYTGGSNQGLIG